MPVELAAVAPLAPLVELDAHRVVPGQEGDPVSQEHCHRVSFGGHRLIRWLFAGGAAAAAVTAVDPDLEAKHQAKLDALNEKLTTLKLTIEGLEKERNFYFG